MNPTERSENYLRSLWNYIEGRYTSTPKTFHGLDTLDTSNIEAWVEFSFRAGKKERYRVAGQSGLSGGCATWDIVADIFAKPSSQFMQITTMRDTVVALLHNVVIEVRDWVGDQAVIGNLLGQGCCVDQYAGVQNDVNRHVLVFDFRYQQEYARAHS